jgi:hypothetical protein
LVNRLFPLFFARGCPGACQTRDSANTTTLGIHRPSKRLVRLDGFGGVWAAWEAASSRKSAAEGGRTTDGPPRAPFQPSAGVGGLGVAKRFPVPPLAPRRRKVCLHPFRVCTHKDGAPTRCPENCHQKERRRLRLGPWVAPLWQGLLAPFRNKPVPAPISRPGRASPACGRPCETVEIPSHGQ